MVLSKESYLALLKAINDRSRTMLRDKGCFANHAFLIRSGVDKRPEIVMLPFSPESILDDIGSKASEFAPESIVTITEAWLTGKVDEQPSKASDRSEILGLSAEHIDHGCLFITNSVVRDKQGKLITVRDGFVESQHIDEVEGRLTGLLSRIKKNGKVSDIKRHPGYKSHFKSPTYTLH